MSQFVINLIWDASVLSQPNAAQIEASVTAAAQTFASNFSNPITLNLHVGWGEVNGATLAAGAIGASAPNIIYRPYSQVQAALPGLPAVNPSGSDSVALTDVQAAAIGLTGATAVDAYVGFSSAANEFVFDQASATASEQFYLGPIFARAVSQVMGRFAELGNDSMHANSVLDFYRYTDSKMHSFNAATPSSFSTDGGMTFGNSFNTDPADAGDWYSGGNSGDAFNATFNPDKASPLLPVDLTVMSVLGWSPTGASWNLAIVNSMTEEWLGRAATSTGSTNDISTFGALFATGGTLHDYRQALLNSSEGRAHTDAETKLLYDTYFGRDPAPSEVTVWEGLILGGADFTTLRSALLADPSGVAHTNATVTSLYDTYFGRDPNPSELSVWQGLIAGGDDFTTLRSTLLSDPSGVAHTNATVTSLYDTYFGRDPNPSELAVWRGLIAGGADFTTVRAALLSDPSGVAHTNAMVTSLYDTYFGRDPNPSELVVWQGLIAGGDDFTTLRSILLADPSGVAHTNATVTSLYDTYFGRDPNPSELAVWQGLIAGGDDFTTLRSILLADPSGVAHTNATVTSLYDTYFGRDPNPSELAVWQGLIAGGDDFTTLRSTLLADPSGVAHTNATVTSLYDTYFGRDPNPSELAVWQGLIAGGDDFTTLRSTLLADPSGVAHTNATVTSLYDTYFGRDPTSSEKTVWQGLIAGGDDFYQMRDVLERDGGSNGVVMHLDAAGKIDFSLPTGWAAVTISNFNPVTAHIDLSAAQFNGINPLDAAHARDIASPLGGHDTLITLDATHSLLLVNVALSALHPSDFVFT